MPDRRDTSITAHLGSERTCWEDFTGDSFALSHFLHKCSGTLCPLDCVLLHSKHTLCDSFVLIQGKAQSVMFRIDACGEVILQLIQEGKQSYAVPELRPSLTIIE